MNYIYLCGPILGRPDSECVDWRIQAADLLKPLGTLDPMRRDYRNHPLYHTRKFAEELVKNDLKDIRAATALLVMFDKPSIGTAMEMRAAYAEFEKPIYVVDISNTSRSPWLIYHTYEFFNSLENACAFLRVAYS